MADPYGRDIPSVIDPPVLLPGREPVPLPGLPDQYPTYLKPIPINTRDVSREMTAYLNSREPEVQRWLYSTWTAERNAIKYQELRNAVRDGEVPIGWIDRWQRDYVDLVDTRIVPEWERAMLKSGGSIAGGISDVTGIPFRYSELGSRMVRWIDTRGVELAVAFRDQQVSAIRGILRRYVVDQPVGPHELGRILRPMIGLTPRQALAVARFRDALIAEGLPARAVAHQVGNYSGFLHRYRAERIARTELSYAWNYGQFDAVKMAEEQGYFDGPVIKEWITHEDERTCDFCGPMDGAIVELDGTYPVMGGETGFCPPAHPRCRCTVGYRVLEGR